MSDKTRVHVTIDENEALNSELVTSVFEHDDVKSFDTQNLDSADLVIGNIGFERKTVNDFASSVTDSRLREQREKLLKQYDKSYVLLEGDMQDTEDPFSVGSDISPKALRGAMARTTDEGIPVIPCSNMSLLVDMAVRLARKAVEPTSPYLPSGSVEKPTAPVAMRVYGCLPGVGFETASALYKRYPTVKIFCQEATEESLQEIPGIGEVTASEIMEAIEGM